MSLHELKENVFAKKTKLLGTVSLMEHIFVSQTIAESKLKNTWATLGQNLE